MLDREPLAHPEGALVALVDGEQEGLPEGDELRVALVDSVAVPEATAVAEDECDGAGDADTRADSVGGCVALGGALLVASALTVALGDALDANVADLVIVPDTDDDAATDTEVVRDEDGDGVVERDADVVDDATAGTLAEERTLPLTVREEEPEAAAEELPARDGLFDSDPLAVAEGDKVADALKELDALA